MPLQRVGDIELFYEFVDCTEPWTTGPAPVLFIHGLGGDFRMWLYQVPAFCGRFPTIAVDLRGHGRSTKPDADFGMDDLGRDLVRLLRTLGAERAHVVGCSLGGMVAQQFALDYPHATASLVLADTLCGPPPGAAGEPFDTAVRLGLQFIEDNPMSEIARTRITNAFSDTIDPVVRDYLIDRIAQNDKPNYMRAARAAFGFSVRERLGALRVPTLVVVGDEDRVTPPFLSDDLVAAIPGARLHHIAGAGHISNIERPEAFNRAVLEFLEGIDRTG
jgi:3-oxoadipate enol-lactonase